ncbi:MAG: hypothetical protein ACLUP5_00185 [Streptococcus sp.]
MEKNLRKFAGVTALLKYVEDVSRNCWTSGTGSTAYFFRRKKSRRIGRRRSKCCWCNDIKPEPSADQAEGLGIFEGQELRAD